MQRVLIRTRFFTIALFAVICLSGVFNGREISTQPIRQLQLSFAQIGEPGEPPAARRPPSLIHRFMTWLFGEIDIPHP